MILMNQDGFIASAEEWPIGVFEAVIALRVDAINMAHGTTEIAARGLQQEMIMIGHETVAVDHHPKAFVRVGKRRQKGVVVGWGVKDALVASPSIHDMIKRVGILYTVRSRHEAP